MSERAAPADRAVITLATGKMLYVEMALVLARSFLFWNRDSDIDFYIFTDIEFTLPNELQPYIKVRRVPFGQLGKGFSPKLHLDRLAPAPKTLFIDSDCMVVGPLAGVFDRFAGRAVSVVGEKRSKGLWFGDVAKICARIGVPAINGFNGGVYYLEPGQTAAAVYERAREIEKDYDGWQLVRLRGHPNDELVMAIAMAEAGLHAVHDDGSIMAPLNCYSVFVALDVFAGRCVLGNPPPGHKLHSPGTAVRNVEPKIPHFVGSYNAHWRYRAEALKLKLHLDSGLPRWIARLIALWTVAVPGWIEETGKEVLRPAYRAVFGFRPVKADPRV
ncbi:MAG: hypothetical protein JSR24_07725 [Proteobacteria bacterium]|nr:hypothetical protein [Pseudomonadota bacterium]